MIRPRQPETAGRVSHQSGILLAQPALPMLSVIQEEFPKSEQAVFPHEWTSLAITTGFLMPCSEQGLVNDTEIKASRNNARFYVVPKTFLGKHVVTNDTRTIRDRMVVLPLFINISGGWKSLFGLRQSGIRWSAISFPGGFHPDTKQHPEIHFKAEVFTGQEKPYVAAPAKTECGEPAAFARGPAYQHGPLPIPACDGAMLLTDEIISGECQCWRNQADGVFSSEE
jgi:hypothetical protein